MNTPIILYERCQYDEACDEDNIPDIWADRYLQLCKHCCDEGYKKQAKLEGD